MAAQAGLCLAWSETPEDTFCHGVAHIDLLAQLEQFCFNQVLERFRGHTEAVINKSLLNCSIHPIYLFLFIQYLMRVTQLAFYNYSTLWPFKQKQIYVFSSFLVTLVTKYDQFITEMFKTGYLIYK